MIRKQWRQKYTQSSMKLKLLRSRKLNKIPECFNFLQSHCLIKFMDTLKSKRHCCFNFLVVYIKKHKQKYLWEVISTSWLLVTHLQQSLNFWNVSINLCQEVFIQMERQPQQLVWQQVLLRMKTMVTYQLRLVLYFLLIMAFVVSMNSIRCKSRIKLQFTRLCNSKQSQLQKLVFKQLFTQEQVF